MWSSLTQLLVISFGQQIHRLRPTFIIITSFTAATLSCKLLPTGTSNIFYSFYFYWHVKNKNNLHLNFCQYLESLLNQHVCTLEGNVSKLVHADIYQCITCIFVYHQFLSMSESLMLLYKVASSNKCKTKLMSMCRVYKIISSFLFYLRIGQQLKIYCLSVSLNQTRSKALNMDFEKTCV